MSSRFWSGMWLAVVRGSAAIRTGGPEFPERETTRMKHWSTMLAVTAVMGLAVALSTPADAGDGGNGNGAPSGAHYNLNIIGMDKDKTQPKTNGGNVIFVKLGATGAPVRSNIWLTQGDFKVCDGSAFDQAYDCKGDKLGTKTGAVFQLPCNTNVDADPEFQCVGQDAAYEIWARALGKPDGKASMTLCATETVDHDGDGVLEEFCNTGMNIVQLERKKGQQKFQDVTNELTLLQANIDLDAAIEKVSLFATEFEDFVWYYDNQGLRLAQLRFYKID
jgi:hypothetical protein